MAVIDPKTWQAQRREGVSGPDIFLRADTGEVVVLSEETGDDPSRVPLTNAFVVWLNAPVVVISEGVRREDLRNISERLRLALGLPDVPVVASLGSLPGGGARIAVDVIGAWDSRELARAEAYVLVQCAWVDTDRINIELDDTLFTFEVEVRHSPDGSYRSVVV